MILWSFIVHIWIIKRYMESNMAYLLKKDKFRLKMLIPSPVYLG